MIEGKLGHHFQVDEMRHIASPTCPAFTGCRSAEGRCCSCTARPTCPAFTADESTFLLKLLSAGTRSSACPVYIVYEGFGKELVLIWQHLFQLISAAWLHTGHGCWAQSTCLLQTDCSCKIPASRWVPSKGGTIRMAAALHAAQHFASDRLHVTPPF